MPRETLRLLGQDIDRLLYAGGAAASNDLGLRERVASLKACSVKVPRLGPLAEQVAKVLGAEPRAAATELLNLAVVVAQLRGASAAVHVPTETVVALPETPALDTPLTLGEVEALHGALTRRTGEGRIRVIREALDRGRVRDLRLLSLWLDALADGRIGELVATEVLPALGDVALGPLREAFSMSGGPIDARRLLCIAKIEERRCLALAERALTEGSAAVRAAALEVVADLDPGFGWQQALSLLATDSARELRAVAARVVATRPSDEGLDALIAALQDEADLVGKSAARSLRGYRHPDTTARVLGLLTPEALAIKPLSPRRRRAKLSPTQRKAEIEAEKAKAAKLQERCDLVLRVIEVLAGRGDGAAMAKLRELCVDHAFKPIAEAARRGLCDARDPEGIELLAGFVTDREPDRRRRAIEAVFAMGEERAYERFAPCFQPEFFTKDHTGVLSDIVEPLIYDHAATADPRWADRLLSLLGFREVQPWAIDFLAARRDPRAVEGLLALLDGPRCDVATVLDGLARLGDRRATAPVVALLNRKKPGVGQWWILNTLERLDDPAAAPLLRAAAAMPRRDPESARQLESLARRLARE